MAVSKYGISKPPAGKRFADTRFLLCGVECLNWLQFVCQMTALGAISGETEISVPRAEWMGLAAHDAGNT